VKLKKLAQIMLISCSLLTLAACSTHRGMNDDAAVSEADAMGSDGAQASGAGDGSNFGGSGHMSPQQLLQKRTYYFDFDKSDVHDSDKPAIFANANYLVTHANSKVIVEGHTDPRGSREYNVALAERRAIAVADLLKSKGVNPRQIRVVSYGAERLASPGHTEQDYQLDRRVVIVYQQR
jgi:peptidoglycan-associated lipoprotein